MIFTFQTLTARALTTKENIVMPFSSRTNQIGLFNRVERREEKRRMNFSLLLLLLLCSRRARRTTTGPVHRALTILSLTEFIFSFDFYICSTGMTLTLLDHHQFSSTNVFSQFKSKRKNKFFLLCLSPL